MDAIVKRSCGLDVHQETVVACVLVGGPNERAHKQVRTFGTMTRDLATLRDWLVAEGVTHVGMESTGVYWKPVYFALEEGPFELIVGNARRIRNVPGRKTDVKDSEWIADLVRHGLIAKSFVPPRLIRELRDLVRYRTKVVQSRTAERNRLQALLETANIKLASVVADVFGTSGMLMVRALVGGRTDVVGMADLAKGKLRPKRQELALALEGHVEEHHRFLLAMQLETLDALESKLERLDSRIDELLSPYADVRRLLTQIPGVDRIIAAVIIAELGVDMSVFLSAFHLASWAGVCPGNNESAGKRRGGAAPKGNAHLRAMLVQAAMAGARKKGTYLRDKYHRLKARRGAKRAALAVAHKILISAYHIIDKRIGYAELGESYLDQNSKHRVLRGLVRRVERMGYRVTVEKLTA